MSTEVRVMDRIYAITLEGVYETCEQLAASIIAVNHGDKEGIVTNLPAIADSIEIGAAIELMNI